MNDKIRSEEMSPGNENLSEVNGNGNGEEKKDNPSSTMGNWAGERQNPPETQETIKLGNQQTASLPSLEKVEKLKE